MARRNPWQGADLCAASISSSKKRRLRRRAAIAWRISCGEALGTTFASIRAARCWSASAKVASPVFIVVSSSNSSASVMALSCSSTTSMLASKFSTEAGSGSISAPPTQIEESGRDPLIALAPAASVSEMPSDHPASASSASPRAASMSLAS
ncbi:hypothetical protein D3C87_1277500 [compost metagenome]